MGAFYTIPWSTQVFEAFRERHSRGTEFVLRLYNLEEIDVIRWISSNSRKWPNFKKCAKYVTESYVYVEANANWNYETVVKYYRDLFRKRAFEFWDEPLDMPKIQLKLI